MDGECNEEKVAMEDGEVYTKMEVDESAAVKTEYSANQESLNFDQQFEDEPSLTAAEQV
jgi:hypothetical protein